MARDEECLLTTGNNFTVRIGAVIITRVCIFLLRGVAQHVVDFTQHASDISWVALVRGARGIRIVVN
jgi:hypothetical protein